MLSENNEAWILVQDETLSEDILGIIASTPLYIVQVTGIHVIF